MRKAFLLLGLLGGFALAQDKTDTRLESSATAYISTIAYLLDGGCTIQTQGSVAWQSGEVDQVQSDPKPFNGARCGTVTAAAVRQIKLQAGVGDGGAP